MNIVYAERFGGWERLRRGTSLNPGDFLQIDSRRFKDHGQGIMLHSPNQRFLDEAASGACSAYDKGWLRYWDTTVHATSCWPMLVLNVIPVDTRYEANLEHSRGPWRACFSPDYPLDAWEEPPPADGDEAALHAWNDETLLLDPPRLVMVHDSHNDANRIFWTCV